MKVDRAEPRVFDYVLGDLLSERDDDHHVRSRELFLVDVIGPCQREIVFERELPNRRRRQFPSTTGGTIWLGEDLDNVVLRRERAQRRNCELTATAEDD